MAKDTRPMQEERQDPGEHKKSTKVRETTFIFLIRGRNCAKTIEKCLRSVKRQTYTYWKALICLDKPTDNSEEITAKYIETDDRFSLITNKKHLGVCGNMFFIIRAANWALSPHKEDVGAVLDADDSISKDALKTVLREFKKGALITHGSYKKMSRGRRTKISRPYPKKGNIRKLPWRGSHLKCIKWKIMRKAKPEWFKHNGKWLQAASDLALMFNSIEIAGLNKTHHIHKVIYYWNNKNTRKKISLQRKCEKILRSR